MLYFVEAFSLNTYSVHMRAVYAVVGLSTYVHACLSIHLSCMIRAKFQIRVSCLLYLLVQWQGVQRCP